jgi:hypothetical protein
LGAEGAEIDCGVSVFVYIKGRGPAPLRWWGSFCSSHKVLVGSEEGKELTCLSLLLLTAAASHFCLVLVGITQGLLGLARMGGRTWWSRLKDFQIRLAVRETRLLPR